jgi:hypothetical protein
VAGARNFDRVAVRPFGIPAFEVADQILKSEIAIAVGKRVRAAVVDNFRTFALKNLGRAGK